jgi:competence protein ComEA
MIEESSNAQQAQGVKSQLTWQQETLSQPIVAPQFDPLSSIPSSLPAASPTLHVQARKRRFAIPIAITISVLLALALYFVWHTPSSTSTITQQNFSASPASQPLNVTSGKVSSSSGNTTIQVYVVGAVKHPGVYTLKTGARLYELLQAAGGTLPNADLIALNLAIKLSDGQEVYVPLIGEVIPTNIGGVTGNNPGGGAANQLVNINTASADELHLSLHISLTTAQNIVNYRLQHGPFTSVDQLQQVVSKSIYNKIKGMVTIS